MPAISIITISFNQLDFLAACVDSVQSQEFADYEHIIVDPGSTDGSRDWLATQSDPRIRVILKSDNGPAQGLNNGLAAATGGIVVYLNSDDEFAPGALARIHELHAEHPSVDLIIGDGWTIDGRGEPISYIRSDRFSPWRYAIGIGTVLQQSTSIKRNLIESGLRFNEENRFNWDTELLFDARQLGAKLLNVGDTIGYFRLHEASITMSGKYEAGLARERERLYARGRGAISPRLVSTVSLPARALKKIKNSARDLANRPKFPGLARASDTQ